MKVKVFQPNSHGKIEFTRAELEKLLNEVYDGGFRDGEAVQREKSTWTWTSPFVYNNDLSTTAPGTSMPLTINSNATQPINNLTCNYKQDTITNDKTTAKCAASTTTLVDDIFSKLSKELNF